VAVLVAATVLGSAAIALVGFALYLAFCAFVVIRTNDTKGLRDVAEAVRAFASVGSLTSRLRPPAFPPPALLPGDVTVSEFRPIAASGLAADMPAPADAGAELAVGMRPVHECQPSAGDDRPGTG
jgi:hypothetical protein